jgi:UDP-N-acetylglucosamine 2-epimerase (non-hydrolysing)
MKILIIVGTRPEAIKMAPLINRLKKIAAIDTKICNTGQHKHLVTPIFDFFGIKADFSIDTMVPNQGLHALTASVIEKTKPVFDEFQPDYVLVHGDTTTSFASALSAFYSGCKVAHVEAGLRTYNEQAPFPEEMNRTLNGRLADVHFAPTQSAAENLRKEGIINHVILTGNTVVDALLDAIALVDENDEEIQHLKHQIDFTKKIILFTGHRRENFGKGFDAVFAALKAITENRNDVLIIYPVHPNPNVKLAAEKYFEGNNKIKLITRVLVTKIV